MLGSQEAGNGVASACPVCAVLTPEGVRCESGMAREGEAWEQAQRHRHWKFGEAEEELETARLAIEAATKALESLRTASDREPMSAPWHGVGFDGTLATYPDEGTGSLGRPVAAMVARVKSWLAEGRLVKIVTARVASAFQVDRDYQRELIEAWCEEHLGQKLPVTCTVDSAMMWLYHHRCLQVIPRSGELVNEILDKVCDQRDGLKGRLNGADALIESLRSELERSRARCAALETELLTGGSTDA